MNRYEEFEELQRKWQPPAGLGRAGPRAVRLAGGGVAVVILAVVMFAGAIAAIVGLGAVAHNQAEAHRLLRDEGRDTEALITRHWR